MVIIVSSLLVVDCFCLTEKKTRRGPPENEKQHMRFFPLFLFSSIIFLFLELEDIKQLFSSIMDLDVL